MSGKLSKQEIKQLLEEAGDIPIGKQINIHHCKQGKGNDKLYIKRLNHGSVLFCHHCGKSGFIFSDGVPAKFLAKELQSNVQSDDESGSQSNLARIRTGQEDSSADGQGRDGQALGRITFSLPRDASRNIRGWSSSHPKLWLTGNGIKVDTLKDFEIYWSETMGALLFPQRHNGELVGYQYRYFPPKEGFPKYLTKTKSDFDRKNKYLDELYICNSNNSTVDITTNRLALVEDYISAIRVASIGYPCCPLWGAQLHDGQLKYLLQKYNKFVILLDNDNNQVKTKQRRIRDRLEAHGATVSLCLLDKDPKHYSDEELIKVLHDS